MNQFMSFVIIAITMLLAAQNCHCESRIQEARGKTIQTPQLWNILGCMITDDDVTKCVRDHTTVPAGMSVSIITNKNAMKYSDLTMI
jgi:hypothetical protein